MASVTNNSPVVTNYTPSTTSVQNNTDVTSTSGAGGGGNNVEQGSLSGPTAAGELDYATDNLLNQILGGASGTDWGALTDSVSAANLSVTVTAILLLLIEVMSQMRQDAREGALEQAQAALQEGLNAAQNQRDSALETRTAAYVTAGLQMAGGLLSMGTSGSDAGRAVGMGGSSALTALGSFITADMTYEAATLQADAQQNRSEAEYQQALGQSEQAFMQQLGDAMKAILSTLQATEQAQHKATGDIYNC